MSENQQEAQLGNDREANNLLAQNAQDHDAWRLELRRLLQNELADNNINRFLRCLLPFAEESRGRPRGQGSREEPAKQAQDQPNRRPYKLLSKNQKQFLGQLLLRVTQLFTNQSVPQIKKFRHQFLCQLTSYERREQAVHYPLVRILTNRDSRSNGHQLQKLSVVDQNKEKVFHSLDTVVIDQQVYKLEQENQWFQLDKFEKNNIDMTLSSAQYVSFRDAQGVSILNISYTYIRHIDIRQLMGFKELRLISTNIKRLSLVNQRKLKYLFCNCTLIDYLQLPKESVLLELHVEYSGQLTLNSTRVECSVFIDKAQTAKFSRAGTEIEDKRQEYVVSCPQDYGDKEVKIDLPHKCHDLIDNNIRECRELSIYNSGPKRTSTIDYVGIFNYSNLQTLTAERIRCDYFEVGKLSQLTAIRLNQLTMDSVSLSDFPNLKDIAISECIFLSQISILGCGKVETLFLNATKISQVDVGALQELRTLNVSETKITQIDVSKNTKLEELDVHSTFVSQLHLQQLKTLRVLRAYDTDINQLDVSSNTRLTILYAWNTIIDQLDVSKNEALQELAVHDTKLLELDTKMLTELRWLGICRTRISEIDLSNNGQLTEVKASSNQIVVGCCCKITNAD